MRSNKKLEKQLYWAWMYLVVGEWFTTYYQTKNMIAAGGDALSLGGVLLVFFTVATWCIKPLVFEPSRSTRTRRRTQKQDDKQEDEEEN